MTKSELLSKLPDIINHRAWGYAELEIGMDKPDKKGVCYRHKDNTSSCGTFGLTWLEVYEKLSKHLIKEGYMKSVA